MGGCFAVTRSPKRKRGKKQNRDGTSAGNIIKDIKESILKYLFFWGRKREFTVI